MKRILLSILASGMCAAVMAIPAKPGFIAYTQPDGTVVNIQISGDEHAHMIYSEDGLLLLEADGRMEYAKFDNDGFPIPSGIAVGPLKERSFISQQLQPKHLVENWANKLNDEKTLKFERLQSLMQPKLLNTRSEEDSVEDDDRVVPMNFGRCKSTFPVLGVQKGLVILVEYEDVSFEEYLQKPSEKGIFDYFNRMLNEKGFSDYGSLGSARDWFVENSNGLFLPDFDVYGPVKLPNKREYYGGNDSRGNDLHPEDMAVHACQMLDDTVDFSQYDRDGDGIIDNVFIFYAGKGEHDSGVKNAVWPHSWDVIAVYEEPFIFDGVTLRQYACTCEYPSGYKRPDGIGTFVHEFSHVMGLPDLYNTANQYGTYCTGNWSVMDNGTYNNDRLTPPNYSSYEKCALGWIDLKPITEGKVEIHDLSSSNEAYVLPTENENEFFFFENRQQLGNDKFLPGHGMLVWHIDYKVGPWTANTVNNVMTHQRVDIVEADRIASSATAGGDPFPGLNEVTSFGYETSPQLLSWTRKRQAFDLQDISESDDGVISFNAVAYNPNEENAVEGIEADMQSDFYYDLMGRRVNNPTKGIFIHKGKKVIF
ncbi:MAG: M6 family metalloprotease domain-containing protein [Muribaculaceae bacterium]|nr:M6 family metalloprotease domain-containing protein [Muribaculaceae bacterium]